MEKAIQKFSNLNYKLLPGVAVPDNIQSKPTNNNSISYVSLPFLSKLDCPLKSILQNVNIAVGFQSGKKLSSLFTHHKQKPNPIKILGVIFNR